MFCPTCGQPTTGSERFCAHCGSELTASAAAPPAVSAAPAAAASAPTTAAAPGPQILTGVRGWLLVFCIWITIVSPIRELNALPYLRYFAVNWFLLVPMAVTLYGVVTGVCLWIRHPRALPLLRMYFGLYAAMLVLNLFNFFRVLRAEILGGVWIVFGWLTAVAFFVGWLLYFRKSERVRNTYGANL